MSFLIFTSVLYPISFSFEGNMKLLFTIALGLIYTCMQAQDTVYARRVLNDLCSKRMAGRGYVAKGDKKAAAYIASEFRKAGLKPVGKSYYQKFPIGVNTFPGVVEVVYNGRLLTPGVDYLIDPASPAINFEGTVPFVPLSELDSADHYMRSGSALKAALIDTFNGRWFEEAAIAYKHYSTDPGKQVVLRLSSEKFTWSSSPRPAKVCLITLRNDVYERGKPAVFSIRIQNRFLAPHISRNVVGMLEGSSRKDSFIVVTAHYDHLGMMGKTAMFPGANDNASGVAMLLNLARYYQKHPQPYSMVFIAFSGEETGLIGSRYFVDHPLIPLRDIRFLINLDLMGNGAEGVMAVNGLVHPKEFAQLQQLNTAGGYLPAVKARGKAANSDHYWFSQAGVPAFFFYLMGPYPHYHDVNDVASAVPFANFGSAFLLFTDFIALLQK